MIHERRRKKFVHIISARKIFDVGKRKTFSLRTWVWEREMQPVAVCFSRRSLTSHIVFSELISSWWLKAVKKRYIEVVTSSLTEKEWRIKISEISLFLLSNDDFDEILVALLKIRQDVGEWSRRQAAMAEENWNSSLVSRYTSSLVYDAMILA